MLHQSDLARFKSGRQSRRSAVGWALTVAGATVTAAACGGSSKRTKTVKPANGQPKLGGQLSLIQKQDIDTYDPTSERGPSGDTVNLVNSRLLGFKGGPDVKYTDLILEPQLAQRWETPDAQTFTFHLQPGVQFANLPPLNGRALTSADVMWSYEYLTRTGSLKSLKPVPTAALYAGLDRIETPDAATVVFHFTEPFAAFLVYTALTYSAILAHEIFDQDGSFAKRAAGSGPWQMDVAGSQPGQRYVFKRNASYFVQGRPYVDQINWLVVPDDATDNAAFLAKQVDLLSYSGLTLESVEQVKKKDPTTVEFDYLDSTERYIYLNVSKPPLSDERVRKAISLSIDRDEFIRALSNGKGEWAFAASRPGLFTQEEIKQVLKYDPTQAKQLLTEAGFANGVDVDTPFAPKKYGAQFISALQLLQAQLKKTGINLALKPVDDTTYYPTWIRSGNFQLSMTPRAGPTINTIDPQGALYSLFYPNQPENVGRVNDAQLTQLIEAQKREVDPAKRQDLIRQAIRRVNDVPWGLALYYGPGYQLAQPYLKGYNPNLANVWQDVHLTETWLDK